MSDLFLYQKVDTYREIEESDKKLPSYIEDNLADFIELRKYQEESLLNTIFYFEKKSLQQNKQHHLLYHMATGSGKTVIMASLILYLYKKGYRNFIFFVNQTNILEKTKENFLNPSSSKYLFDKEIEIEGMKININEVDNFNYVNLDDINIHFTTTQKLHMDINFPKENSVSIEDFEDDKMVMISDESHHVNTMTKSQMNKSDKEAKNSWEHTVMNIFEANKDNILLEFTATCDLKDKNVNEKYKDKIIYNYPLKNFRRSGYTKEFQNFQSETNHWERTLIALIVSEYRKDLFTNLGQNVKPVVLLKFQRIKESEDFYKEFFKRLDALEKQEISKLNQYNLSYLNKALKHFYIKDNNYNNLINALKLGFNEERAIIMNGKRDNTLEKQLAVNSLEDEDNPYRIIFTVDMLNEGWDVLNLFDIVRLYDIRKSKNYTTKEAQLIGRGARYCPFTIDSDEDSRFKRKYDHDLDNEYRILETLLYHSMQDSKYIYEINQALKEEGLLEEDEFIERNYKLKKSFKSTDFYKTGKIYSNKRVEKDRSKVEKLDSRFRNQVVSVKSNLRRGKLYNLLDDREIERKENEKIVRKNIKIKDIDLNILYHSINNYKNLRFNRLKYYFPKLSTLREFLQSENYMGNITLRISTTDEKIDNEHIYKGVDQVMALLSENISSLKHEYEGSKYFKGYYVHDVIKDKKIRLSKVVEGGLGESQIESTDESLKLDLSEEDWYIFNDNYGTDQEKAFIVYLSTKIEDLKKKYEEIYLIRNERFKELALYDFETGSKFEPDFILILKEKDDKEYDFKQVFIEPKGSHLIENDKWKEKLLLNIENNTKDLSHIKYEEDDKYRFIGLPFFNTDSVDVFEKQFNIKL